MASAFSPQQIASLHGSENARVIVIALFSLSVYEWMITLDDEMKYFWTGPWCMSRILFLLNRYLNPTISLLALVCYSLPKPSLHFCKRSIQTVFISSVVALGVVQAMLVVRVWFLFGHSRVTRVVIIACFIITNVFSLYLAVLTGVELQVTPDLTQMHIVGCRATRPNAFWRLWLPALVLHTVLYGMIAFRALNNRRIFKEAPILKRLVRDGGFFYFVVFISILFTSVGSFLRQYPSINIPAIFSVFPVATASIAASRVMLSIHSLAAKLGSDSAWLLNNIELSRVPWRYGATEGELIVDRFALGFGPDTDEDADADEKDSARSVSVLKMSRVGRWTDETW